MRKIFICALALTLTALFVGILVLTSTENHPNDPAINPGQPEPEPEDTTGIAGKIREQETLEIWYSTSAYEVWGYTLSDPETIRAVKRYINSKEAAPAEDKSEVGYEYPLIGILRRKKNTYPGDFWRSEWTYYCALYSRGILAEENGSAWKIHLSWEEIEPLLAQAEKAKKDPVYFPNLLSAAAAGGTWNTDFLRLASVAETAPVFPATDPKPLYHAEVTKVGFNTLTVTLSNRTEEDVAYYPHYSIPKAELQIIIDGNWYPIPGADWNYGGKNVSYVATPLPAVTLIPGQEFKVYVPIDHWTGRMDNLPQGHYRWVCQFCTHEFDI